MSKKDADLKMLEAVAGHLVHGAKDELSAADRDAMKRLGWSEKQYRSVRARMRGYVDQLPDDLKAQTIAALTSNSSDDDESTDETIGDMTKQEFERWAAEVEREIESEPLPPVDPAVTARLEADVALMIAQARAGLPITRPWRNRRLGPVS
jgi:hypothetical protein